jgi:hypothetical protein
MTIRYVDQIWIETKSAKNLTLDLLCDNELCKEVCGEYVHVARNLPH